jgi:hypothetical protein
MMFESAADLRTTMQLQLRYLNSNFIIYENIEHRLLLDGLFLHQQEISKLAIYKFFDNYRQAITEIISKNTIPSNLFFYKYLYQLCNATYYLYNEEPDVDFLKDFKHIYHKQIKEDTKKLAISQLRRGIKFIEEHPIDYQEQLIQIAEKIL